MNKLLSGIFGVLALAAVALPAHAAPVSTETVSAEMAMVYPGETSATVQTVQYYSNDRAHFGFRRPFRRPFYGRPVYHRPFYGRHYGPRRGFAPVPFRRY